MHLIHPPVGLSVTGLEENFELVRMSFKVLALLKAHIIVSGGIILARLSSNSIKNLYLYRILDTLGSFGL